MFMLVVEVYQVEYYDWRASRITRPTTSIMMIFVQGFGSVSSLCSSSEIVLNIYLPLVCTDSILEMIQL